MVKTRSARTAVAHFDAFSQHGQGKGRAPARSAAARPMIVSGAAPPRVDTLRRVRRCMSRPVFRRFCHAALAMPYAHLYPRQLLITRPDFESPGFLTC